MGDFNSFVSQYWSDAVRASQSTGIAPSVILAQAGLESNYGSSAPGNNLFGIKGSGGTTQTTSEFINGQWTKIKAGFATFASPSASFDGYANFINNNQRYSGVAGAGNANAQASALQRSGYATDPNYGTKVSSIASKIDAQVKATQTNAMRSFFGDSFSDAMVATGNALSAPGNAVDKLVGGLDPSAWFQRIALAILAILLIGIALSMLADKAGVNIVSKSPVPLPI